jgi:hypothetical protein
VKILLGILTQRGYLGFVERSKRPFESLFRFVEVGMCQTGRLRFDWMSNIFMELVRPFGAAECAASVLLTDGHRK